MVENSTVSRMRVVVRAVGSWISCDDSTSLEGARSQLRYQGMYAADPCPGSLKLMCFERAHAPSTYSSLN